MSKTVTDTIKTSKAEPPSYDEIIQKLEQAKSFDPTRQRRYHDSKL